MSEQGEFIGPEIIQMTNIGCLPQGSGNVSPTQCRGQLCAMTTCESEQQQSMNPAPPLSSLSFFFISSHFLFFLKSICTSFTDNVKK